MIVVELAGVPVGKGRARFSRAMGLAFTPAKTRSYESALRLAAQDAMDGRPPLDGPVRVSVIATFPVPKSFSKKKHADAVLGLSRPTTKPDADNLLKVLDAINMVVFGDDKQIVQAEIIKLYGERPSLRIEVQPWVSSAAPTLALVGGGRA